jgi:DNA-binding protein YbaB
MVARMEVKEPIEGVCDNANVMAILPISGNGQVEAKAPKSDKELTAELNSNISYLQDKGDYEDEGMVNLIVNCKGELVKCEIDNKTKSPELDDQIVAVFAKMKIWTAATINNQAVDTIVLYSFKIKNGKITLN